MFRLAWRNLWRNRRRTYLSLALVAFGSSSVLLYYAFTLGTLEEMARGMIDNFMADVLVTRSGYSELKPLERLVEDPEVIEEQLKELQAVAAWTPRLVLYGLVSTPHNWSGCLTVGTDPEAEAQVSNWSRNILRGRFIRPDESGSLILGERLAERLKARPGGRVVLMVQTARGEIESRAFKVAGTVSVPGMDEGLVVLSLGDLQKLAGVGPAVSGFFVRTASHGQAGEVEVALSRKLGEGFSVRTWEERVPGFKALFKYSRITSLLYLGFVVLAAAIGILNVLYMAVAERTRELGVMMAIGMKPRAVRGMIFRETTLLLALGIGIGAVLSAGVYAVWARYGLDLSRFADGMELAGLGARVYPAMDALGIIGTLAMVSVLSWLAALYPAFRASRLRPVEALRVVR